MLVCPTLRTAAVGVTRAGRHDGGRRLASNERPNFPGVRSYFAMPPRKHRAVPRFWLELGACGSLFRLFAQWLGYYRACQLELPTITWQSSEWSVERENCVVGIMMTCFVVNDGSASLMTAQPQKTNAAAACSSR